MIAALRAVLAATKDPQKVTVRDWRVKAADERVVLRHNQLIDVAHPKARFRHLDPHAPYTAWVNPGRFAAGLIWMATVAGLAVYGRKAGRGPLKDLNGYQPFSSVEANR